MQEIDFTSTILKNNISVMALVAANVGEGNTTAAIELAAALKSYARQQVLVVDMAGGAGGLAETLRCMGREVLPETFVSDGPQLRGTAARCDDVLLFSLDEGEAERVKLDKRLAADWLQGLTASCDYVLFDMPPYNSNPEYAVFMQALDGVLLTLNCRSSRWEVAQNMKEHLEAAGVNIIGAVLNQRTFPVPSAIYALL